MSLVLLAAGCGMRLGDKTDSLPKTLLTLAGKPILSYILKGLQSIPHQEILIVGGFHSEKIASYLLSENSKARFIYNPHYTKGNLQSLLCARPYLTGSFAILNSDHIYSPQILSQVFTPKDKITAICDSDRILTSDDMKVKSRASYALDVMDKKLSSWNFGYIGLTIVPSQKVGEYWQNAKEALNQQGDSIHVESVLNKVAANGGEVFLQDVSGSTWLEIDTSEDLARGEKLIQSLGIL